MLHSSRLLRLLLVSALCKSGLGGLAVRGGRQLEAGVASSRGGGENVSAQDLASWKWARDLNKHKSGQNSTDGQLTSWDKPRVYFLFLTMAGPEHMRHWKAFFESADPDSYRGFIHCVKELACRAYLKSWNPLGLTQIETVPTVYCEDLMSAMVALLARALREAPERRAAWRDKFVFVSESTLPVKPFSHVLSALTRQAESDFCFGDVADWPALLTGYGTDAKQAAWLVKHSQWSVLSREHAEITAQNWPEIKAHRSLYWNVPVMGPGGKVLETAQLRDHICTDEWATFASVYGGIASPHFVDMDGLSTGRSLPAKTFWHGACRTFTYWSTSHADLEVRRLTQSMLADSVNHLVCNKTALSPAQPDCFSSHPMTIEYLSWGSARLLRKSSFLFARKFTRHSVPLERYRKILLSP